MRLGLEPFDLCSSEEVDDDESDDHSLIELEGDVLEENLVAETKCPERREMVLLGGVFNVEELAEDNFLGLGSTPLFLRFIGDFPVLSDGVVIFLVLSEADRAD